MTVSKPTTSSAIGVVMTFLLAGCTALQVGSSIQNGRNELLIGNPKIALAHFRKAAELDPDYRLNFSILEEGVWTYVGRAYYDMGKLSEARQALEKARTRHPEDHLARLYFGLVLARDGDRQRGLKETEAGLRGLGNWLDYIEQYLPEGPFWDPGRDIRSEIEKSLVMISGKDINWPELIASSEWIGSELEEEIDRAHEDYLDELLADGDDGKD